MRKDSLQEVAGNSRCWVDNKLDSSHTPQSEEKMKANIAILLAPGGCQTYHLLKNNCEHVASFIRYGVPVSPQVILNAIICNKNTNSLFVAPESV